MKKIHFRSLPFFFLFSVFLLGILKVQDTDAWMHLSLGRLIWQSKGFPATESFVYTNLSLPFSYSSWLFGLTYYLAYLAFNIYGVILLKAITVTAAFFILLKDSLRPYRNHVVSILVLSVIVIMARHRFVERPDTFLMVFLSFSIFSMNAFVYDNKKYIYALPFVHMLWANSHSSVVLMFVPFLAFLVGGTLQRMLTKRGASFPDTPSRSQLGTLLLVFIASFGASLISPYSFSQYSFGSQFLSNQWYKQTIAELLPPTWSVTKWPYVITGVIVLSFILNRKRVSLINVLLVVPFLVLPFTAIRFIFLEGIVAGPVLARNISSYLDSKAWKGLFFDKPAATLSAIWLVICSIGVYTNTFAVLNAKGRPGFGIDYTTVPENALKYMDVNGIEGRVFNFFDWGGYIVWRDFPKRSVFIDPRGYISPELWKKSDIAVGNPAVLHELETKYGFESILCPYGFVSKDDAKVIEIMNDGIPLDNNPEWALVYWDDLSRLYVKKSGKYASLVRRDQYRYAIPYKKIDRAQLIDNDYRSNVIEECKRNIRETASSKAYIRLGSIYSELGRFQEAIGAFTSALDRPLVNKVDAHNGIAHALFSLGDAEGSIRHYLKSLALRDDATTLYNIGIIYWSRGDNEAALSYLEKAIDRNPNLTSAYPIIIRIYSVLGKNNEIKAMMERSNKANIERESEQHFKDGLQAYLGKQYAVAIDAFLKSIEVNPSNPSAYSNIGYVYYDTGDLDKAFEYQRLALDIDPGCANAYYGLALIYKKQGDLSAAKTQWQKYLRIEPSGYFSRQAMDEIAAIDGK